MGFIVNGKLVSHLNEVTRGVTGCPRRGGRRKSLAIVAEGEASPLGKIKTPLDRGREKI